MRSEFKFDSVLLILQSHLSLFSFYTLWPHFL
nr:MAG TPA: hypothetical protein [Caudoviricetes sp.]